MTFLFYCNFLVAVEVAVEMAVEFQSGSRKKSGSRKTPHPRNLRFEQIRFLAILTLRIKNRKFLKI